MKLTIYWKTHNKKSRERIIERFGLSTYMSVNRETDCDIKDEDIPLLEETERCGFIQIRKKK